MQPASRTMPTITAAWHAGYGWVVALPGDRERICVDRAEVIALVEGEACGASIRWIGSDPTPRSSIDSDSVPGWGPSSGDAGRSTSGSPDPIVEAFPGDRVLTAPPSRPLSPADALVGGGRTSRRRRAVVSTA